MSISTSTQSMSPRSSASICDPNAVSIVDGTLRVAIAPSVRVQNVDGAKVQLNNDLGAYSYAGHVLLYAARLYQGQTTNFCTPGGGFASVVAIPGDAIPDVAIVATTPSVTR